MGQLFCYTLSARAIGATVSAGALHAQGWGFESLIAHHRIVRPPAMEAFLFFRPIAEGFEPDRVRSRGNAKRFPAQHARAVGPKRKRAASAARGHSSSPTTELETVLERGPFLFGPISWDSNPQGCGAEETRSVFQRSTRGAKRRSGCGRRSRTRTSLIAHH